MSQRLRSRLSDKYEMTIVSDRISAVTFDSYTTLLDVDSVNAALDDLSINPTSFARLWRSRSLDYARMCNFLGVYYPFCELNRMALKYALAYYDLDISAKKREKILSVYHDLDVFDDVQPTLEALSDAGYDLWVVSNGSPDMLESLIKTAHLEEIINDTISADEVERYKPDPDLYRQAAARTGTPINDILHVSAGWVDVMGASNAGMMSAWVNRKGDPWETFFDKPDVTVETLTEIAEFL